MNFPFQIELIDQRERTSRLLSYSGSKKRSNWSEPLAANGTYEKKSRAFFVDFSPKARADVKIVTCLRVGVLRPEWSRLITKLVATRILMPRAKTPLISPRRNENHSYKSFPRTLTL